jgi:putative hydrolase of the HAD superfamily
VLSGIHAIIFDLDGTLYINDGLAREVQQAACRFVARLRGIEPDAAADLIRETRVRLSQASGIDTPLTSVCSELGGSPRQFHEAITPAVNPELHLKPDERVSTLLASLRKRYELYIYTNNNRTLSGRTLSALGISGLFNGVFTIEDTWRPKPDRSALRALLASIGRLPEECLFVGDRYDIDLRMPADMGAAVMLISGVDDLFRLGLPARGKNQ